MGTVSSVGAVAAEGDDHSVHIHWSDVNAPDVMSVTIYWCLSATTKRGECAVSIVYRIQSTLVVKCCIQEIA